MKKKANRFYTPEERSKELEPVMLMVKEQVEKYEAAKKAGTLRKKTSEDNGQLFNV